MGNYKILKVENNDCVKISKRELLQLKENCYDIRNNIDKVIKTIEKSIERR